MSVTVVDGDLPSALADALRKAGAVAVDTETSGLDYSRDRLELCQLFSSATGTVLLRNVRDRPQLLGEVLIDPSVLKVFHYAPFDLRFLEARWQLQARRVECTKAASRLLNPELPTQEHSLKSLLARHLGVQVGKGAVRTSDWGAAVLSAEQIEYAVADVVNLLDLAGCLRRGLEAANNRDLFAQVCEYMPVDAHLAVTGIPNPLEY